MWVDGWVGAWECMVPRASTGAANFTYTMHAMEEVGKEEDSFLGSRVLLLCRL